MSFFFFKNSELFKMALNLFKSLFIFLFFNISSSLSDHFEANGIQIHWVDYENETFFNLSTSNIGNLIIII